MKHKKILASSLSLLLCGMFMVPVMASSSSNETSDGKYVVSVFCTETLTSHTVNARNGASYPTGKAYVVRSLSGAVQKEKSLKGTSFNSYWSSGYSTQSQYEKIINARTTAYGLTVRAHG